MGAPGDRGPPPGGPPRASENESSVPSGTEVHAFLIADMRGWTSFTQEHGDEEAGRLAARFAKVAREVIGEHQGKVLELRGDEALCVFGSPRSAIRAAVALQQRFVEETIADPTLPLTVGIGLDAGEAVPVDGGYRGGALNVAARLCSRARAGEVLASREIVHLARRIDGLRFTERGQAELKGLDQPVHMVQVRAEEQDTVEAIAPYVRTTAPPRSRHRRRNVLAAVVAFAVVTALIAVPLARGSGGSSEIAPNSIGVLDPESGEVTATLGLGARPGSVAASEDAVWVTNPDVGTVTRIVASDQDVRDPIPVGENPTGIAFGEGAVWVVESGGPSVSRISLDTNAVVKTIRGIGNGSAEVAVGRGAVWVTNRFDGTISRISPDTNEVVETIPVGLDPRGIAVGFGSVWVGLAGSNEVVRIDPATSEIRNQIDVGNAPGSLAVSTDGVWVVNTLDDTVSRISPDTNSVVPTVGVGDGPSGIAVVDGIVWVGSESDGTLSRIEPGQTLGQPSVSTITVGSVPQGLAGVNGDLWVSVRGTATTHRGGTLRVVSAFTPGVDPHFNNFGIDLRVHHLLGDGLVAYEPVGGHNPTLVPDLATSLPTPTPDGRTYTFQLRPDIRYSNDEEVVPSDLAYALERGFRGGGYGAFIYAGLVGAAACLEAPRTCDLSDGVVADDGARTITFQLTEPDPDFLKKLTLPVGYPVPPSVPDEAQESTGVPGTGPYMVLEGETTDNRLVLVRNPYFDDVWSPAQPDGYVDRIEWVSEEDPQARAEAVAAGDADVALDLELDASAEDLDELLVQHAAQVHISPTTRINFVKFDTQMPPFNDIRVRRALNLALDRDRIVQIFGGVGAATATCQELPPNFPGYEPYCPYTADPGPARVWTAPDFDEARRLVHRSGTANMRVVVEYGDFYSEKGRLLGDYLEGLLDDLGYDASAERVYDNEFQMALADWGADYPSASNLLALPGTPWFACEPSPFAPGSWRGFCRDEIDALIERAARVQAADPVAAAALWTAVDRAIVDEAPHLWLVVQNGIGFVSEGLGNYQFHPQWGVLLNQLWVR